MNAPNSHNPWQAWLLLALALVLLGAEMGYDLWHTRQRMVQEAQQQLEQHSLILAETLERRLYSIDAALKKLRNTTPVQLTHPGGAVMLEKELRTLAEVIEGVRTLLVIDAAGHAVASNRRELVGNNFASRAYFKTFAQQPLPDRLHLGEPFTQALGGYSVNLVRPILGPQGKFIGVIAVTIDQDNLRDLLLSQHANHESHFSLVHGNGIVLKHEPEHPHEPQQAGAAHGGFLQRHLASGQSASLFTGTSALEDARSMVSIRTLQPVQLQMDNPLFIAASRDESDILAPWQALLQFRIGIFLLVSFVASAALLMHQRRQRVYAQTLAQEEAARERATAMLQRFIDHLPDIAYVKDANSTFLMANRSFQTRLGIDPATVIGKANQELFPGEFAAKITTEDRQVLDSGQTVVIEESYNGRDFETTKFVIGSEDGARQLGGISVDITQRKQAERDLRNALNAAQRFREALDNVNAYVYMKDRESRYFYANRRALEFFGCSEANLIGAGDERFFPPPIASQLRAADLRVLAGENTAEEVEAVYPDGSRHVLWAVQSPITLDDAHAEVWGISGIATDISGQRQLVDNLDFLHWRNKVLLDLPGHAETLDEVAFMQRALEFVEGLTDSQVSFIHFVNEDEETIELVTWSRHTLESFCRATFDRHYPVSQAGIWAEALRQRQPVVINDYASASGKRGLPEGHAHLERLISLPVIEAGKVVMLAGIGNKASDYTERDTESLQLIANEVWRLVQRGRYRQKIERFSRMFERTLSEIFTFDPATMKFVDASYGACKNTGYSLEELRTLSPLDLTPQVTAKTLEMLLAPLRSKSQPFVSFTTLHQRKDGSTYDAEIHLELTDEVNPRYVALARDITERTRLEQSVRQLAQAVEQSPESIAITDLDANIQYVNAAFIRNTGYSRKEIIGQNPRILQSGQTPKETYADLWNTLSRGHPWEGELFNKRKDGSEYVEWARISPIRQPDGRITQYLAIKQDITARRQAELAMAENLAYQKQLNKQLENAQQQLLQSEKMASIGQLAAGVAHELNNPIGFVNSNLNTLDGYLRDFFEIADAYTAAEVAYGMHSPLLDEAHALKQEKDYDFLRTDIFQLLDESKDGLSRVTKIVRDLKDFSRAGDAAMQWADLHQGIDTTLNIVWNELKYKCTVTKHYGALPKVWCEPSQLNQVFMNLLVNAGHAIAEKGTITIKSGVTGDQVFVSISDTGTGIAPEHLTRIFDPFFTTKPIGKGTGLGLSLAFGIVQKHRGHIDVHSEPGKGTTFTIWLPINPPEAVTAAPSLAVATANAVPPAPTMEKP